MLHNLHNFMTTPTWIKLFQEICQISNLPSPLMTYQNINIIIPSNNHLAQWVLIKLLAQGLKMFQNDFYFLIKKNFLMEEIINAYLDYVISEIQ